MRKSFIITAVLAVFLGVMIYALNVPILTAAERVVHPVGQRLHGAGSRLRSAASELPRLGRLQTAVRTAEAEARQLRVQLVELERLSEQNRQLRDELGFARDPDHNALGADIVNFQPDGNRDMVRINVGTKEGVESDMPVVTQGVLLGVTHEVSETYATVVLVSDTNFRALVTVGGTSGVLRGQIGSGLVVERLARNQGVSEGDSVVTNGQDGVFPAGLLVGTVRSLAQAPGGVFDTAQVTAEASARDLQVVTVLRQ